MGDRLEDEDWIKENIDNGEEADWNAEDDDETNEDIREESSSEDEKNEVNLEERKQKRKRKFEELKMKKKQRVEKDKELISEDGQLTVNEMLQLLNQYAPPSFKLSILGENMYEESHFFYPNIPQTTESLTKAPSPFVRAFAAGLSNYKKLIAEIPNNKEDYGAPLILIICASAARATEIIKSISAKLIKCKIAKLFAKHFKVVEQIEMLSKEYFPIAVGTPNRLNKLIEVGALHLDRLKLVLIDYTPDVKNFTALTLPEVNEDSYTLLYGPLYKEKDHLKIAFIRDSFSKLDEKPDSDKNQKKKKFLSKSTSFVKNRNESKRK